MSVGARAGLTLVEVVVAVAILGVTLVVVASVFGQASNLRVKAQRDDEARVVVENEIERLRALPFWAEGEGATQQGGSLVGAVFPHAVAGRNTESCYFSPAEHPDVPAGAFVTCSALDDTSLRVTARFAVSSRDGWLAFDCLDIQGFSCGEAWRPPSTALIIAVAVLASAAHGSVVLYEQQAVITARHDLTASLAAAAAMTSVGR